MNFTLRFTPKEESNITHVDISRYFESLGVPNIVSQEMSSKGVLHYHAIVWYKEEINSKEIENKIKLPFKKAYGTKWEIWCSLVKKEQECASYTVKDGLFSSFGISEQDMSKYQSLSFKKVSNYGLDLKTINTSYDNDAKIDEFVESYVDLHVKYDRPINERKIKDYIRTKIFQKDKFAKEKFVNKILVSIIADAL